MIFKKIRRHKEEILKFYLPVFLWMVVIFYLSSIKGSGCHKERELWFYVKRKGAHILEYFILSLLAIRLFKFYEKRFIKIIFFSFFFSLLYAFSDEAHQLFVYGREGKILDVGIDLAGIVLGCLIFIYYYKKGRM